MELEKSKEVKKTVTAVKQSQPAVAKYLGLKQTSGIRAGANTDANHRRGVPPPDRD